MGVVDDLVGGDDRPGTAPARVTGSTARPLRVVLADDSVLFRSGLAHLLADEGFQVVGEVGDATGALELVERERPDVVILDIRRARHGNLLG